MSDYKVTDTQLISVANAIRAKTGKSAQIEFPTEYVSEIGSISGGGSDDLFDLTDYIKSSGTQYIDTNYIVKSNTRFDAICSLESYNDRVPSLFGVRNSDGSNAVTFWIGSNSSIIPSVSNGLFGIWSATAANVNYTDTAIDNSISYNNKKVYLSFSKETLEVVSVLNSIGNTVATKIHNPKSGEISQTNALFLFTINQGGNDIGSIAKGNIKLYRFRIYEGNDIVHDFIPWTDSNDVVCLKDTVTGDLKYNLGTGTFTYGTDSNS